MSQGNDQLANDMAGNDGSDDAAYSLLASMTEQEPEEEESEEPEEQEEAESEEEDADPEDEEQEEVEPEYEVKVNGKTAKVKQSELIAGYQMQKDYQQKTAELAEQRRAVEAQAAQVRQERETRATQLDVLIDSMHRQLVGDSAALQELIETDPQAYLREQVRMQQRVAQLNEAMQHRQAITGQQSADEQRAMADWVRGEREALQAALPEWTDPKKAGAEQKEIAEYLIKRGYSQDELNSLQDHRALLIARDAAKYQALVNGKAKQAKPEPPKSIKPGAQVDAKHTNKTREKQETLKAASRSQKDGDWLAYLQKTK